MRIRILDKYIFKEVLMTFVFAVCAFSAVFVGSGTLFRMAQYITEYGASISSVMKIFVLSLPGIIVWTFPMSMLLAGLLTIGRLSSSSEITAMKACGVSFYRIAAPAVLMGFLVSVFSINFNEYVVPWSNEAYRYVLEYEIKGNTAPKSQEHIVIKQIEEGDIKRLVYARSYDEATFTMNGVTMQNFEQGVLKQMENAEYAVWENNEWTMHNGMIYDVGGSDDDSDPDGNSKGVHHNMQFSTQVLPVNASPQQITREQKKPEEMSMEDLRDQIEIMKAQFLNTSKLETELYQRFTIPAASFIFTLIAVPLGMQNNRRNSSAGFAMSIVIIFTYYGLMTLAGALGQNGMLHPGVAAWIPNIVGALVGMFLMWRASR